MALRCEEVLLRRQYLEFASTEPEYDEHIAMLFGYNW